jgi:hypothetical protein
MSPHTSRVSRPTSRSSWAGRPTSSATAWPAGGRPRLSPHGRLCILAQPVGARGRGCRRAGGSCLGIPPVQPGLCACRGCRSRRAPRHLAGFDGATWGLAPTLTVAIRDCLVPRGTKGLLDQVQHQQPRVCASTIRQTLPGMTGPRSTRVEGNAGSARKPRRGRQAGGRPAGERPPLVEVSAASTDAMPAFPCHHTLPRTQGSMRWPSASIAARIATDACALHQRRMGQISGSRSHATSSIRFHGRRDDGSIRPR